MDWNQLPQNVVATTVTLYWTCVIGMIIRSWSKFRVTSGSLPKTRLEKRMWLLWVPTILAWNLLAWNSNNAITDPIIALGMPWLTGLWYSVLVVATLAACFGGSECVRRWPAGLPEPCNGFPPTLEALGGAADEASAFGGAADGASALAFGLGACAAGATAGA